jgi:hypothetical protein
MLLWFNYALAGVDYNKLHNPRLIKRTFDCSIVVFFSTFFMTYNDMSTSRSGYLACESAEVSLLFESTVCTDQFKLGHLLVEMYFKSNGRKQHVEVFA